MAQSQSRKLSGLRSVNKEHFVERDDIRNGKIKIKEVKGGTRCWSEHQDD